MDLLEELKKIAVDDVVFYRDSMNCIRRTLVYRTLSTGLCISGPSVPYTYVDYDTRTMSVVLKDDKPLFADNTLAHIGMRPWRYKNNPEERRFAEAWLKENDGSGYKTPLMDHMLGDGVHPKTPTQRDITVAATVIQWLGSSVGQCFLRDLGYVSAQAQSPREERQRNELKPKKGKKK
jgi:hypothetical protein